MKGKKRSFDDISLEHLSVGHRASSVGLSPGRHAQRALAVKLRWTRRARPLSERLGLPSVLSLGVAVESGAAQDLGVLFAESIEYRALSSFFLIVPSGSN
jgi:hypothetical protein